MRLIIVLQIPIIQIFHRGAWARERIDYANREKFRYDLFVNIAVILFFNIIFFSQYLMIGAVLYLGARWIESGEITVGILKRQPLPIIENKSKTGFYDYQAKYLDERTEYLFDTIDDPTLTASIQAAALDCFDALGCRHFARADFILSKNGIPYVLEINTIPGFTNHSLLPMAAAKIGLSMSDLCAKIIEAAYSSLARRKV